MHVVVALGVWLVAACGVGYLIGHMIRWAEED
jgi:hypothetical protein